MIKFYNIQALRGIAVLLVVFYHSIVVEEKYNPNFSVIPEFFNIGNIGVDLFFIISGFIMVIVTKGYFSNKKLFIKFIYSRFSRIYPMYWFYSILLLPILFIKPEWINSSQNSEVNLISSFLLFPSEKLPLVMVGWTLIHEIYFYIVFSLFIFLINKKNLFLFSFTWLVSIIILNILSNPTNPLLNLIIHPLTIEFIFGIFLGIYFSDNRRVVKLAKYYLLLSFLSLIIVYLYLDGKEVYNWDRLFWYGIPSLFIVFFTITVEINGFKVKGLLLKIGDASYSIYLAHLLTLNVTAKVFNLFLIESYLFELIMVLTMIIATIIYGLISYKYIEIPIINFFKSLYSRATNEK